MARQFRAYQDWRARRNRVQELSRLWSSGGEHEKVMAQLYHYLEHDGHWQVRREVVHTLVQLGPEAVASSAPLLRIAASQDPHYVVRASAMMALRGDASMEIHSLQDLDNNLGRRLLMSDEWMELDTAVRREALFERSLTDDDIELLEENVRQNAEYGSNFAEDDYLKAMLLAVDTKAGRTERTSEMLHELSSVDLRSCDDQYSDNASTTEQLLSTPQEFSDLAVQMDAATHEAMLRANRLEASPRRDQPDLPSELSLLLNERKVITV